jgi:leader peptidase (prepilin peptidase) / N-methyltransferase
MFADIAAILSENAALFAGVVFLFALLIGSFLNVVIYRLPIMMEQEWRAQAAELQVDPAATIVAIEEAAPRFNLITPRSACPKCKSPIKARHNIPVLSWLLLRGRCASCKAPILLRYPLVELITALLSAWVAWHFGLGWPAVCGLVITWCLIALTGIDIDHQLLPDSITLPLLWAGLLTAVIVGPSVGSSVPVGPTSAILGAVVGYLSLWTVYHLFRLITGKEGMGFGDFKLFAALGAWLGWQMLPLIILLSAGTGAVFGIAMILFRGRDRAQPIPFGPYLAAAGWIAMLYGESLVRGYSRLAGLH